MSNFISSALKNWVPYRLQEEAGSVHCRWLYLGDVSFDKPFIDDTISICKSLPQNSKLKRSISSTAMLNEWAASVESISPAAFIFHVSRCGSTLLSQMLALNPANIALSEVPFFDEILRWGFRNNTMDQAMTLFLDAVTFYGAKRNEQQQHVFIKADSWHIHFYKELRELFPQTPFLLLYRRPDEVIRSQQLNRGMQAIPGFLEPGIFGFDREVVLQLSLDEYMARVLETYYSAFTAILQKDKFAFAFNYQEGMINIIRDMMAFCGLSISGEQLALMKERSSRNGKFPDQIFSESKMKKQAPDFLKRAFELYDELERLRKSPTPSFAKASEGKPDFPTHPPTS